MTSPRIGAGNLANLRKRTGSALSGSSDSPAPPFSHAAPLVPQSADRAGARATAADELQEEETEEGDTDDRKHSDGEPELRRMAGRDATP